MLDRSALNPWSSRPSMSVDYRYALYLACFLLSFSSKILLGSSSLSDLENFLCKGLYSKYFVMLPTYFCNYLTLQSWHETVIGNRETMSISDRQKYFACGPQSMAEDLLPILCYWDFSHSCKLSYTWKRTAIIYISSFSVFFSSKFVGCS